MGRIEILHLHDPDGACTIEVYVDGHLHPQVYVENIDPRGRSFAVWDAAMMPGYSESFRRAVVEARAIAREYIDDEEDQ